jgi:hypothetical protein
LYIRWKTEVYDLRQIGAAKKIVCAREGVTANWRNTVVRWERGNMKEGDHL